MADDATTWKEFHDTVNMTAEKLEKWLDTERIQNCRAENRW